MACEFERFWPLYFLNATDPQVTFSMADMKDRSSQDAPKILCVEPDLAVLESRCAVLNHSGYNAVSASPQLAEIVLRGHKFDLIVLSTLRDYDRDRILSLVDGAQVLVLDGLTMPTELLGMVAQCLNGEQRRA